MPHETHSSIHSLIGIAEHVLILASPAKYIDEIDQMAKRYQVSTNAQTIPTELFDFIFIFLRNKSDLVEYAAAAISVLDKEGSLWFGYPTSQSSYPSDITINEGWEVLNDAGWESVSDLSIDSTWDAKNFARKTIYRH